MQNDLAVMIRDTQPVSKGHSLIIPRRHVSSFFDTSAEERTALMALLDQTKKDLDREFSPDDYNVGINDGLLADKDRNFNDTFQSIIQKLTQFVDSDHAKIDQIISENTTQ